MDLQQLEVDFKHISYFLKTVESDSITQAAEKLYISQPVLSKNLMALERQIGILLFERKGKKNVLTDAGRTLYIEWKRLLEAYEKSLAHAEAADINPIEEIRIGCFPVLHPTDFLEPYMCRLERIAPHISVTVKRENYKLILEDLQDKKLDIAFILEADLPEERAIWEYYPTTACALVAVVQEDHPLARKEELLFSDLNGEALVFPRPEQSPNAISGIHRMCCDKGVMPASVSYVNSDVTTFLKVRMSGGVTLGPDLFFVENSAHVKILPVEGIQLPIVAVWMKESPERTERFLRTLIYSTVE